MRRLYFDYNASTPLAPEVAAVMRLALEEPFGNPSSAHWAGAPARAIIDTGRRQVAELLGCSPGEIVFTGSGTEANNFALQGAFFSSRRESRHIITTRIEHPAILSPCVFLERLGAKVTYLPVDSTGRIDPDDLRRAITPATILISVMHANNEVGTIQPIDDCAGLAREHGVLFHTDAAQSVGKIATDVGALRADLLSLAGHKIYAPKGIGALYVREGVTLEPLIHGAGHESGRRAGTESALLIAALGKACELAKDLSAMAQLRTLRDRLWNRLHEAHGDKIKLNGHLEERLPNTLNVSFVGRVGSEVLGQLDGVAASTGSACHSGRIELSPVLAAMGVDPEVGMGAIRFSLGRFTTPNDVDTLIERLTTLLATRGS